MKVLVVVLVLASGGPPSFQGHPIEHEPVTLGGHTRFTGVHGRASFRVSPGRHRLRACTARQTIRTITVRRHPQRVTVFCNIF